MLASRGRDAPPKHGGTPCATLWTGWTKRTVWTGRPQGSPLQPLRKLPRGQSAPARVSQKGSAWRPRHACVARTRRATEARRDAVRYRGLKAQLSPSWRAGVPARRGGWGQPPSISRSAPAPMPLRLCASARENPEAHSTWTLDIPCWILDIPEGAERTRSDASGSTRGAGAYPRV